MSAPTFLGLQLDRKGFLRAGLLVAFFALGTAACVLMDLGGQGENAGIVAGIFVGAFFYLRRKIG